MIENVDALVPGQIIWNYKAKNFIVRAIAIKYIRVELTDIIKEKIRDMWFLTELEALTARKSQLEAATAKELASVNKRLKQLNQSQDQTQEGK